MEIPLYCYLLEANELCKQKAWIYNRGIFEMLHLFGVPLRDLPICFDHPATSVSPELSKHMVYVTGAGLRDILLNGAGDQEDQPIVFVDTETTGLNPAEGHRIIELAMLLGEKEVVYRFNPGGVMDPEAEAIHGISLLHLECEPHFGEHAVAIANFLVDCRVVAHRANFDISFLDAEFARVRLPSCRELRVEVVDSYNLAIRKLGGAYRLDNLCDRLGVDRSERRFHGAKIDAMLLRSCYEVLVSMPDLVTD